MYVFVLCPSPYVLKVPRHKLKLRHMIKNCPIHLNPFKVLNFNGFIKIICIVHFQNYTDAKVFYHSVNVYCIILNFVPIIQLFYLCALSQIQISWFQYGILIRTVPSIRPPIQQKNHLSLKNLSTLPFRITFKLREQYVVKCQIISY